MNAAATTAPPSVMNDAATTAPPSVMNAAVTTAPPSVMNGAVTTAPPSVMNGAATEAPSGGKFCLLKNVSYDNNVTSDVKECNRPKRIEDIQDMKSGRTK